MKANKKRLGVSNIPVMICPRCKEHEIFLHSVRDEYWDYAFCPQCGEIESFDFSQNVGISRLPDAEGIIREEKHDLGLKKEIKYKDGVIVEYEENTKPI